MLKADLRKMLKVRRDSVVAAMTAAERCAAAVLLADTVEKIVAEATVVAAFLPIGSEIGTLPLIDRIERRGTSMALPHVTNRRSPMRFLQWRPGDPLIPGPMDLVQPAADAVEVDPDLILTPLLGFDATLNRLGYGAGFYDRAFTALPSARRIGIAWSCQAVDSLPVDPWDVPLHAIASEKGWVA